MSSSSRYTEGWPLVGWCAIALTALIGSILAVWGIGDHGFLTIIRTTAFTSFLLFTTAFVASSLLRIWPAPTTRWIRRNRRYLGVSFAVSHTFHLAAILTLVFTSAHFTDRLSWLTIVAGSLAYLFIALMVATSFDRTAAWIGARPWRTLHTTGMYVIWVVFVATYFPMIGKSFAYLPFAVVLLAALALRFVSRQRPTGAGQRAHLAERV